jgi:hypothetical protein
MNETTQTDTKKPNSLTSTPWAVLTFKEEEIRIVSRFCDYVRRHLLRKYTPTN